MLTYNYAFDEYTYVLLYFGLALLCYYVWITLLATDLEPASGCSHIW